MLEKPELEDEKISVFLKHEYGLPVVQVSFLPLGADPKTAAYRIFTGSGTAYFFKLRSSTFDEISVTLPKFLSSQGVRQIIPPLETLSGQLWGSLELFKTILYPFVDGQDGYEVGLSPHQWVDFGRAIRRVHTVEIPPALASRVRQETYTPRWREMVMDFLEHPDQGIADDRTALNLRAVLKDRQAVISDLVKRAGYYGEALRARSPQLILCHSDLHPGNLLISPGGAFHIVDWDDTILAPKERDLMFIGGGQGFNGIMAQEEEALFYHGYGPVQIDRTALAYYRYERIVQDIAVFCVQILSSKKGGEDRERSLHYVESNFSPGNTIDMAYRADPAI